MAALGGGAVEDRGEAKGTHKQQSLLPEVGGREMVVCGGEVEGHQVVLLLHPLLLLLRNSRERRLEGLVTCSLSLASLSRLSLSLSRSFSRLSFSPLSFSRSVSPSAQSYDLGRSVFLFFFISLKPRVA